jgi:streptogramin lyase
VNLRSIRLATWTLALACALPGIAWAIQAGDILVADTRYGIFRVDPTSGAQDQLSGINPLTGHGYYDVTSDASGNVYAIDNAGWAVYRIDLASGTPTLLSYGNHLQYPRTIDAAPDGNLYVVAGGPTGAVVRVDPASGAQSVVTTGLINAFTVGDDGTAHIVLSDEPTMPSHHLYRLDLASGARVKVANNAFYDPVTLATDAAGNVVLCENYIGLRAIHRVYPALGAVALVSSGGQFVQPYGLAIEASGAILVTDNHDDYACARPPKSCRKVLFRVDPVSGAQTVVAERHVTIEPGFYDLRGVDVYRGPTGPTPVLGITWKRVKTLYR